VRVESVLDSLVHDLKSHKVVGERSTLDTNNTEA
jgi:hypothetical protein